MIISNLMGLFFLFGFCALEAQVLLLRETAQVFSGHELSLAAALAAWLLWTAAGVRLAARHACSFPAAAAAFAAAAALSLPLARFSPSLLPALSQPGLACMLAGSLLLTLPAGLANGLAAGAALPAGASRFYAAEAAGACAAGAFTLAWAKFFPFLDAAAGLALPALGLCAAGFYGGRRAAALSAGALVAAAVFLSPHACRLKPPAPAPARVVQAEGSRLAFTGGGAVYEDGRLLYAPEDTWPEEFAQLPLMAARPGHILISGSGAFRLLPEALKHRPVAVEIAEPDPWRAAALAGVSGAVPGSYTLLPLDPRRLAGRDGYYDLILQSEGSPDNAALNRFFTAEYFAAASRMLKPGGLLAFRLPFAANYLPPEKAYAAACVLAAARAVFPSVRLIPGDSLLVIAGAKPAGLSTAALAAAYAERGLRNKVVVPEALPLILDPYRAAWAEYELAKVKSPPANRDLDPLAYFRFWRAWLSMVMSPSAFVGLAALLLAGAAAAWRLAAAPAAGGRGAESFLMGFWAMSLETAFLLAFQAGTGRLSAELGLLFAAFMGAGAAGAAASRLPGRTLHAELAAAALSAAAVYAAPYAAASAWPVIAGAGFLGGYYFGKAAGGAPGGVYALDLAGGAAGGLAVAAFAAPAAGISAALWLSCAAACAALLRGLSAGPSPSR